MTPATSYLASSWGLPRPIIKFHQKKKWVWSWARGTPQTFEFPLIFLQRLGLATSNFDCRRGSPKSHPEKKWAWRWARKAPPKFRGSPLIFLQRLQLAISNLARSWGLPSTTIKPHPQEKWAWPWAREPPKYLGFPFNISVMAAVFSYVSVSEDSCY